MPATATKPIQKTSGLTKRQRLDRMHGALWTERGGMLAKWNTIGTNVLPSRPKWTATQGSQTAPAFGSILDNTAGLALRTLSAGLMSKLSSPSVKWMAVAPMSRALVDNANSMRWCDAATDAVLDTMEHSNFYTEAETLYSDCALFGTAAMAIEEDPETIIRCEAHPIGSYGIAQDSRRRVNTFAREWTWTAAQVLDAFGPEYLSDTVRQLIEADNEQVKVTIRHLIYPNPEWRPESAATDSKRKRFAECYWDISEQTDSERFLRESGYDDFPLVVPRWGPLAAGDVWGNCQPGALAIGAVLSLNEMRRQTWNALRKQVSPVTVSGPAWRNKTIYSIPGANNVEDMATQGDPSLRAMYEVKIPYAEIEATMEQVRGEIRAAFFADIMAPILLDERNQRATAAEIYQTRDEQYGMLGPVVTRQSDDFHAPAVDRILGILVRLSQADWAAGNDSMYLPLPPVELQGEKLHVKLNSTLAIAQEGVAVTAIERHTLYAGQMIQLYGPAAGDNDDPDELMRLHAKATGVPPKGTRSRDESAQVRTVRAQQQAAAQAAAAAPGVAKAAKDLSETKLNQDSALDALAAAGAGR